MELDSFHFVTKMRYARIERIDGDRHSQVLRGDLDTGRGHDKPRRTNGSGAVAIDPFQVVSF